MVKVAKLWKFSWPGERGWCSEKIYTMRIIEQKHHENTKGRKCGLPFLGYERMAL